MSTYFDVFTALELNAESFLTLARTVEGEAGNQCRLGKQAVAHVVFNRVFAHRRHFGYTVEKVCLRPWQFSCWNKNDPNRERIAKKTYAQLAKNGCVDAVFVALARAVNNDPTFGACHYFVTNMKRPPSWAKGKTPCIIIGDHSFYNDVD